MRSKLTDEEKRLHRRQYEQRRYLKDKIKRLALQKRYRLSSKGKLARLKIILKRYGLCLEDYFKLLHKQKGKCAICGTTKPGARYGRFAVDHNHQTGQVRGLLCNCCNSFLGHINDNVEIAHQVVIYLKLDLRFTLKRK